MEGLSEFFPIRLVDGASQVVEDCLQYGAKTIGAVKQTLATKYKLNALKLYIRDDSGECRKELSDDGETVEAEVAKLQAHKKTFAVGDKVFTAEPFRFAKTDWRPQSTLSDAELSSLPGCIPKGTEGIVTAGEDRESKCMCSVKFKGWESEGSFSFENLDPSSLLLKPCAIEFSSMQAESVADAVSAMIKSEVSKALAEKDTAIQAITAAKNAQILELKEERDSKGEQILELKKERDGKDEQIKTLKRKLKDLKDVSEAFVSKRQALAEATRSYASDLNDLQEKIKSCAEE